MNALRTFPVATDTLFIAQSRPASEWTLSRGKRLLDIAAAALLSVVGLPILVVACLLVWATMGRPVLFRQTRVGRGMCPFVIYKIRTMGRDAESLTGPVLAEADDPRVTPVGRVLRKARLDELPQLYNVWRGEMSMVGPRPERAHFVREFIRQIPGYEGRFVLLPGITGPAQVAECYHATAVEKLRHDLDYYRNASLAYDLRVLWQTIAVVLRANGC